MKHGQLYLVVDGGGLTTDCMLVDGDNRVLARAQTSASNYNRVGLELAVKVLRDLVVTVRQRADLADDVAVDVAVFGLAGVDTAADHVLMQRELGDLGRKVMVVNDTLLLLGLLPQQAGIALIAGTGSGCVGKGQPGLQARAGGHGPDFDEGGGWWLAQKALAEVARLADGRSESQHSSYYVSVIFQALEMAIDQMEIKGMIDKAKLDTKGNVTDFTDLYQLLYRSGHDVKAALHKAIVPVLFDAAEAGMPEAWRLVDEGARELANHVRAVAGKLQYTRVPLVVSGSLLVKRPIYRVLLTDQLVKAGLQLSAPMVVGDDPLQGGLLIARNR
jgi:N-acetylglucosamine kinase-like BadF-type ATPase